MSNKNRTVAAGLAVAFLGVTAAGALLFGVAMPIIALASQGLEGSAAAAVVVIGAASVLFGGAAAFATRAVATARPIGTLVGIGVGVVPVMGAAVASASGGWHPALASALLLGTGVVASLLATRREQVSRAD